KEVAEALNSASTEQQAAGEALSRMADLLGVATGWVWLRDPASGRFYNAAVQSLPPYLQEPVRMTGRSCWCLELFRSGRLTARNIDVVECSRLAPAVESRQAALTQGLRCHASVPLYAGDRPLAEALGALSRQFTADTGVRVRMDISDVSSVGPLLPDVESELYRIASEALTNVQKHAGAREASLRLDTVRGRLRLIVSDAGVGFRVRGARRRGFGLVGIEDRAQLVGGRATIGSAPGRGTTVTVTV